MDPVYVDKCKGVARIWFRGGPTHFGGARPPIFRLRPQITRVPPYVLLATPGFRGGGRPGPPPPGYALGQMRNWRVREQ